MTKQWLLVRFKDNWADEMDVCGFSFFDKFAWDNVLTAINNHERWPEEIGFGTNESNEYRTAQDLINEYKVVEVTQDEKDTIQRLFEMRDWGWGNFPAPWENWDEDDDNNLKDWNNEHPDH